MLLRIRYLGGIDENYRLTSRKLVQVPELEQRQLWDTRRAFDFYLSFPVGPQNTTVSLSRQTTPLNEQRVELMG